MNLMATVLPPDLGNSFPHGAFPTTFISPCWGSAIWRDRRRRESQWFLDPLCASSVASRLQWTKVLCRQKARRSFSSQMISLRDYWFIINKKQAGPLGWFCSSISWNDWDFRKWCPLQHTHTHTHVWVMIRGASLLRSKPLLLFIACH